MKKLIPFLVLSLVFAACSTEKEEEGETIQEMYDELMGDVYEEETYAAALYSASLEDVTGGDAFGLANLTQIEGFETMDLNVSMEGLAPLEEGFFYEGWVVNGSDVVSTGAIQKEGDLWTNNFVKIDYAEDLEGMKYILTLEPDDGNPAPADHVLDGTFTPVEF